MAVKHYPPTSTDWKWNDISCKVDAKTICRGEAERCPAPSVGEGTWVTAGAGDRKLGGTLRHHCPLGHKPVGNQVYTADTATIIPFMDSQKRNCVASFPISIFMCLWGRFIYFQDRFTYFPASRLGRQIVAIYKSPTDT